MSNEIPDLSQEQGNKILNLIGNDLENMSPDEDIYWEVKEIKDLWFKYGNKSENHSYSNHRFVQKVINGEYDIDNYDVNDNCKMEVDGRLVNILKIILDEEDPDNVEPYCEDISELIQKI